MAKAFLREEMDGAMEFVMGWGCRTFRTSSHAVCIALMAMASVGSACAEEPETSRIQGEIDRVAAQGGGRVTVGKGVHRCGTLYLKSNVELHLEEGAELQGGLTPSDYDDAIPVREVYTYEGAVPGTVTRKAFVYAENATNIAITGRGVLNVRGQAFFNRKTWAKPRNVLRPRMIVFMNCRGIRLEDATFKDSPTWTMWLRRCEDIVVSRIRIDADQRMINSDGIDIDACRNVQVGDSYFSTGDDCLILRAIFHRGDVSEAVTENVVVSNCCLSTPCQGVRIACPSDRMIRNAVFRDMTFTGNNAIFANQEKRYLEAGNTGNIRTQNLLFENWKIDCYGYPICVGITDGVTLGDFGHMTFRNIEFKSKKPVKLRGNATSVVKDVVLENVRGSVAAKPALVNERTENVRIAGCDIRVCE